MTSQLKKIQVVFRTVFADTRYSLLAALVAFLFFTLNAALQNYKTIKFFFITGGLSEAVKISLALLTGFSKTVTLTSFISIIIISLLFGIFISLLVFKVNSIKPGKNIGFLGAAGLFLGVIAPGCAACGVGLLALFGISAGALTFLPFHGIEISILAIVILIFAVNSLAKGLLECDSCQIQLGKLKGGQYERGNRNEKN